MIMESQFFTLYRLDMAVGDHDLRAEALLTFELAKNVEYIGRPLSAGRLELKSFWDHLCPKTHMYTDETTCDLLYFVFTSYKN